LERIRHGEHVEHFESVRRRKDGKLLAVSQTISPLIDAHGQIVGASRIVRDVTDRKLAEAALVKAERLAAAGRVAGILAHEINNPLQAVTNLMVLLGRSPRLDAQDQAHSATAVRELDRIAHLTRQSLKFYRESTSPAVVPIGTLIEEVLDLYDKEISKKGITVDRQLSSSESINSYPGDIRQVFSTLLVNAVEATNQGGKITVRVRQSFQWKNLRISGIRIVIADSGVGISPESRSRLFEPFFTTKSEQGTGLGLWVAQGIVTRLGGSIGIRSSVAPGKRGTCVSIFLPNQLPKKS
jgi:two-component system CheB/CheR fusion protein